MPRPLIQPSRTAADNLLRPLAALLTFAACGASAQSTPSTQSAQSTQSNPIHEANPYYIGASQAFTHSSNVYAVPNGPGDTYSSTGLLGGFDQPIGRERLYANGSINVNRFQDQTVLNNVSYSLAGGLDWATVNKLSGSFYGTANRSLASLNNNGTLALVDKRNLLTTDEIGARVRWGGESKLTVEGGLAHGRVNYSATEAQSGNASQDSGSIGLYYRPSGLLRLGTAVRLTHGDQPNALALNGGGFESNSYNSRSLDLLADWTPSARSGMSGRLSWTRQSNSTAAGLDFSGLTGALSGTYAATGKIALNASLSRDAGINSGLFSTTLIPVSEQFPTPITISGLSQFSQTTNTLALGATYAATAKINATANYAYQHAALVNTISSGGASLSSNGTDNLRHLGFGVNYVPARNWLLACSLGRDSRTVSGFTEFSYSANTVGCSAQYTIGR